jgi:hypothetical protein
LKREDYWRRMLYECDKMERAWLASIENPSEVTRALYNDVSQVDVTDKTC